MKIVLVNHQDTMNINAFSGAPYFMSRAIKSEFEEVIEYNDFESTENIATESMKGNIKSALETIGQNLTKFLHAGNIDADYVICQGGNSSVPFYNFKIPLVYWHDSTWSSYLHGYDNETSFNNFKQKYESLYLWDKMAIDTAKLVVFSSHYVAEACIRNYKIKTDKVEVVPFGANLAIPPSSEILDTSLKQKLENTVINLTFIGKDWERKGLSAAYELTRKLNAAGVKAVLNVIGGYPKSIANLPYLNLYGFLDKSNNEQFNIYKDILNRTHFIVHPALSEPFGIALCEANAYGIPIIGTNLEGLKTIVINGKNGYLFNRDNFAKEATLKIQEISLSMEAKYKPLAKYSIDEFNRRLNWSVNTKILKKILADRL